MENTRDFGAERFDAKARQGAEVVKELEKRGHKGYYVETAQQALELVLSLIPQGASVGIPGTTTIREIDAIKALANRGNPVIHHWDPSLSPTERDEARFNENNGDVFLTSSNAITEEGVMVNIDGAGNRLAGMSWSRGTRIFVVGMNKLCPDTESALRRVHDVVAPANAARLQLKSPSAATTLHQICRVTLITEQAPVMPVGKESHVILVGESLGY